MNAKKILKKWMGWCLPKKIIVDIILDECKNISKKMNGTTSSLKNMNVTTSSLKKMNGTTSSLKKWMGRCFSRKIIVDIISDEYEILA